MTTKPYTRFNPALRMSSDTTNIPYRRVALVTGAARGIGKAIALQLATDGINVAVNDVDTNNTLQEVAQQLRSLGVTSLALVADISVEDEVQRLVKDVTHTMGSLDIVQRLLCAHCVLPSNMLL